MLNISKYFFGTNGVVLGWGCKTSSLQTNCFVMDNIETQVIRHIELFMQSKRIELN